MDKYLARYWIYQIECVPTKQIYIGQTIQSPMSRWSAHMSLLKTQRSKLPLLSEAWMKNSDITKWRFQVVGETFGKVNANHLEAKFIFDIPKELRLNTDSTSTLTLEKRIMVESMLAKNMRYVDINAQTGVSMGMISKIKKSIETLKEIR